MIIHKCYFCNYETNKLCNFKNHIFKKNKCSYLLKSDNIEINNLDDYYRLVELHKKEPDNEIFGVKEIVEENIIKIHANKKKKITINDLKCEFCNKIFSRKDHLKTHYKTCREKKN